MATMARDVWTDQRLDDLNKRVDDGFGEMRGEFQAVRTEMRGEFKAVRTEMSGEFKAVRTEMREEFRAVRTEMREEFRGLRGEIGAEFRGLRGEIAAMNRSFQQLTWGLIGAVLVGFLSTAAAIVTQL